jgi:mono/diheme cytochrome c family protein
MKWFVLFFLTASCLAAQSLPGLHGMAGAQEMPEPDASPGRKLYLQYCGSCHGLEGQGDGPVAPALRTPPADLTRIAQRRGGAFPEAEITAYIDGQQFVRAHGSREMPVWGIRFSEQFGGGSVGQEFARGYLHVLVEYLKSIQQ